MNAQLATRTATEPESEMLPQHPPPWIVRSSAWLLIAFFLIALVVAIFVHIPETVTCRFVLVPKDGADPIQSPYLAVVNRVAVSEGQSVKAGAELFVLRSDEIRGMDTQSRTLAEDLRAREDSLTKSDSAYTAQLQIKDAEISQAESEVTFRERHAKTSKELVDRMERLSKSGGISQVELLRLRLDLAASEKDWSVAQRTVQQVNLERQRMEMDRSRQRGQDVAEIENMKYRLGALKSDLENSDKNMVTLRAPYDAVVISVSQRSPGSVVQKGQELCQLALLDSQPRARLSLNEEGLPKLAIGQRVRFFFDAFPYQRYGAVGARLDWISPSAVILPEGPHFIGLASIDQSDQSRNRKPLALRPGMRGSARVVIGRRTLIEYAFEPVRQLRENAAD